MKLNAVVLSIKPRLMIWAPLGALTQKRTVPVVEIEPLNVVPVGNIIGNCADDAERVIAGRVVADAKRAIKDIIRSAVIAILVSILIFFIFPLDECPEKRRLILITISMKKRKNKLVRHDIF